MGRCKAQRAIQALKGLRAKPAHRDLRAKPALRGFRAKPAHRDLRAKPALQALPVPFLYSSVPCFPLPPQWR